MQSLTRGAKVKLGDLTAALDVTVGIGLSGPSSDTYDISCFGVDGAGKLSDDRYFVFYNQRSSPESAIRATGAAGGDNEIFEVSLPKLPSSIVKLVFTAAIDGPGTMSALQAGHLRVAAQGSEVARFSFSGSDFAAEKAMMIGEVYLKDVWRVAAVGQGFNGGLSALLAHFGGEEAAAAAAPPPAPAPAPAPPPPPPPPATPAPEQPKVNLGKITLEKKGDARTVSLKKGGGHQPIHVNLNWNQTGGRPAKRGILGSLSGSSAPDLDLGCMFELVDGRKGVIQPLGGNFGSRTDAPHIYLDKDDRTGAATDGENLYILRPDLIHRVMVFAMIYEGSSDFTSVGGHMTIKDQEGNETLVRLNNPDANRTFCAICTIKSDGETATITKEERYFRGHREADEAFGFGFSWTAGRK